MTLSLSRKALMLVSIPLVFEVVFVASLATLLHQVEYERSREVHAREVARHFNNLLRILLDRGSSLVFSYLAKSEVFHRRFLDGQKQTDREEAQLFDLVRNEPFEREATVRLLKLNSACRDNLLAAAESMRAGNLEEAKKNWTKVQAAMEELRASYDEVVKQHEAVQHERLKAQIGYQKNVELLLYAGVGFNILLAVCLALYFNRGTSQRFQVLIDNTTRLASGKILIPALSGNDEIAYLDQTFRQMSESLARARQKERAVVENAAEMICTINAQNRITSVNPACETILARSVNEILGSNLNDLISADDKDRTFQEIKKIVTDKSKGSFETCLLKSDGTVVDVAFSAQWSDIEQSLICVVHDISLRKSIERLKRDFVAMVSHDLRTPLTAVQMVLGLMQAEAYGEISSTGHMRLKEAEGNVERLIALVNELLTLDKMESGMLDLSPACLSVSEVIEPARSMVLGVAAKHKVEIDVLPYGPETIYADKDRIIQVLSNLLSNAIKFSPPDGKVIISVEQHEQTTQISITDRGRGVPPEMQAAIFERFKQVEQADEHQKGGTGLGLAICTAIIERHGGSIGLESEPGKGSKFWFRLAANVAETGAGKDNLATVGEKLAKAAEPNETKEAN
jgi:PAS domain S-box-containing protein